VIAYASALLRPFKTGRAAILSTGPTYTVRSLPLSLPTADLIPRDSPSRV
jgi:hypothetical protein